MREHEGQEHARHDAMKIEDTKRGSCSITLHLPQVEQQKITNGAGGRQGWSKRGGHWREVSKTTGSAGGRFLVRDWACCGLSHDPNMTFLPQLPPRFYLELSMLDHHDDADPRRKPNLEQLITPTLADRGEEEMGQNPNQVGWTLPLTSSMNTLPYPSTVACTPYPAERTPGQSTLAPPGNASSPWARTHSGEHEKQRDPYPNWKARRWGGGGTIHWFCVGCHENSLTRTEGRKVH
jgi:hypothetical protein